MPASVKKIIVLWAFGLFQKTLLAAEFRFANQILTVPDGYEVELVSNTNVVHRPVSTDFDELGRLYVTDSSGSSEKGPTQYEKKIIVSCDSKIRTAMENSTSPPSSQTR